MSAKGRTRCGEPVRHADILSAVLASPECNSARQPHRLDWKSGCADDQDMEPVSPSARNGFRGRPTLWSLARERDREREPIHNQENYDLRGTVAGVADTGYKPIFCPNCSEFNDPPRCILGLSPVCGPLRKAVRSRSDSRDWRRRPE